MAYGLPSVSTLADSPLVNSENQQNDRVDVEMGSNYGDGLDYYDAGLCTLQCNHHLLICL